MSSAVSSAALVSALLTEVTQTQTSHQVVSKSSSSSSFISESSHHEEQAHILSRLLLSEWNESMTQTVPLVFSMLNHSETSEKVLGWKLLPVLLRSQYRCHISIVRPLCQLLDKQVLIHLIKEAPQTVPQVLNTISTALCGIFALSPGCD